MNKRAALLVAVLTAACVAACGNDSDDPVTLWMYPVIADEASGRTFWHKVEAGFEREYGVDLRVELQPWASRQEKLGAALMAGDGPDVVLLQTDMIPQYVADEALQPVDEVLAGSARVVPKAVTDALSVDGRAYAVPLYRTVTTTVYNRKLFAEAGVTELPRTWDEVKAAAPKLAARGVPILDYSGSTEVSLNRSFYPLLWQAGGSVFTADGTRSAFASAEGVSALRFLVDLKAMHGLPDDAATKRGDVPDDPMAAGRVAMDPVMTADDARLLAAVIGEQNTVIGLPLRDRTRATYGTPAGLSLLREAKRPDAARKLLAYLSSPAVVDELCVRSHYFPPWTENSPSSADEMSREFAQALPFASAGDSHPLARKVMGLLAPHLQAALLGTTTPERALADAAAEVDAMLRDG
jgi:multiple sugar transport system substrate-binding protein